MFLSVKPTYSYVGRGLCIPNGIRVYDGNGDNEGGADTAVDTARWFDDDLIRKDRCAAACSSKRTPNEYGPWSSRGDAVGFAVVVNSGRCYCHHVKFASCPKLEYQYQNASSCPTAKLTAQDIP